MSDPAYASSESAPTLGDLAERFAADLALAWERGERLRAEEFLGRHAELLDSPDAALRLIYEEVCQRQERGEHVTAEELVDRFPIWAGELSVMLDCHRMVQAHLAPPRFPVAGEWLGDFQLIAELGRGTQGRVFLATQATLADRAVVLKITPRQDREFLSLARLQHTHIIPLHGVYEFPADNLRVLCQPYFGGSTLAQILDQLQSVPLSRRTGSSIVNVLDELGARLPISLRGRREPRRAIEKASYTDAVVWIGTCIADALHYAHERELVHLDLKPSNVLLAADVQPLLLDFHLAVHPVAAGQQAPEGLGGTCGYMSPEQQAAYTAARHGLPVPSAVDRRSDVFSLGCMLYNSLSGIQIESGESRPRLEACNPQVSVGLADIIHRCLAPNAADRYPDADSVASDLRRHLTDLPLRGVPNRSWSERWSKWRRRRPSALLWTSVALVLSAALAVLAAHAVEWKNEARNTLREGQEQLQRGAHDEAVRTLTRGRALATAIPFGQQVIRQFDAELRKGHRLRSAEQLHTMSERLRLHAGAEELPERDRRLLSDTCRNLWELRELLADHATAPLSEANENQIRNDLLDMALLWTDLQRPLIRGDASVRSHALQVLLEAERLCGPSESLTQQRAAFEGIEPPRMESANRRFWEHAAIGRTLLRAGQLDQASAELARAVQLRPQDFWSNFYHGVCAYRQGRCSDAVQSFSIAIALAPELPEVYHNRALAHSGMGNQSAALRDYDRALELNPALASAALNRGILRYELEQFEDAQIDLENALRHGANPATTEYNAALVRLAKGDPIGAEQRLRRALAHSPEHAAARSLLDRLQNRR